MNDSTMNNNETTTCTLEEVMSRHKKEIKSLDGEKRASIKKMKGSIKGKKVKDSITAVEDEYAMKLIQLEKRHQEEIVQWEQTQQQQTQQEDVSPSLLSSLQISAPETITTANTPTLTNTTTITNTNTNNTIIISMTEEEKERHEKMKKLEKIRIKREKQRQVEKEREMEHMNNMKKQQQQPSMKSIEMEYIQTQFLDTVSYRIQSIPADGNCLYRAIASQISRIYTMNTTTTNTTTTNTTTTTPSSYDNVNDILLKTHITTMNGITYQDIRNLCATTLEQNEDEFGPFCEYEDYDDEKDNDDNNDNNNNNNYDKNNNNDKNKNTTKTTLTKRYQHYCNRVRNNSNAWGGHLEIRAISMALQRPIVIYSMQNQKPVIVDATTTSSTKKNNKVEPIRLSYHLHYYALGEHYNEVVPK